MSKPLVDPARNQREHWSAVYEGMPAFFGEGPSLPAQQAVTLFESRGVHELLELGAGQGRDTVLFAEHGFAVTALDYSDSSVAALTTSLDGGPLSELVEARVHDVRNTLPFPDSSFDACYSHMLLCMELSTAEVSFVLSEIRRVLKPGGVVFYTVRSDYDPHYRAGDHIGDDAYEIGDFVVHFFSEEKIRHHATGFRLVDVCRQEEGSLPRDLYVVTMDRSEQVEIGARLPVIESRGQGPEKLAMPPRAKADT